MSVYLNHTPRYHTGLSKWEHYALVHAGRPWFADKRPHVHHMSTYGACGCLHGRGSHERHVEGRQYRKRARREGKNWITEQEMAA